MITKNFYKMMALMCHATGGSVEVVDINGVTKTAVCPNTSYFGNLQLDKMMKSNIKTTSSITAPGLYFGTGNVPPTVDDYNFSGTLISNVTVSQNGVYESDGDSIAYIATYTIINNASTEITISEIGIVGQVWANMSGTNGYMLTERTVLDSPVTIPANGVGQITYTIRMVYPAD